MSPIRRGASLLLAATFALSVSAAGAQDDGSSTAFDDLSELEGIEQAVSRGWSVDFEELFSVTPEDGEDPFAAMEGVWFVYGMVYEFDGDDNAGAAYETISKMEREEWVGDLSEEEGDTEISIEEVDDLGDEAFEINMVTSADEGGAYRINVAREDEYLFMAMAIGTSEDGLESADGLIDYLVNEGEAGDDEEFDEAGGSTGGLWDFFPDDDHESVEDLEPAGDEILFQVPDEE